MADISYGADGQTFTASSWVFSSPSEERATEQAQIRQNDQTMTIWCDPENPKQLEGWTDVAFRYWIFGSVGIGIFAAAFSEFNKRRSRPFGGARQSVQSQEAERG